jgi:signal transduction histidine kinase
LNDPSERVLILAPHGRDAAVARAILGEAGISTEIRKSLLEVVSELDIGAGVVVITEEALRNADLKGVVGWLSSQPTWSDLPIVLLTNRGGGLERNPVATRLVDTLGNVTFLERPFHPTTLVSVVRTALRSRRRQYEARELLIDREHNAANLEILVRDRTNQLLEVNRQLRSEISEREQAETALRQAQKMEAVGQLTGGIAHDFNNLLMAIIANLDLLRHRIPEDDKLRRLVESASQAAHRGASLTQRLLAFARKQELNAEAIDLGALIGSMNELLTRAVGPLVEVAVNITPRLPAALVDRNQLELAVLNLAVNARDAMPNGGKLTISLDETNIDPSLHAEIEPGRYLRISVCDTGIGMDEETLARAVEPFFSTKEPGKGTGLGLSMVHGLAGQTGGALRMFSKLGEGTVAELLLPLAGIPIAPDRVQAEPGGRAPRSTILVVDDDALISMSTADMLADLGHEVVEAVSGWQALDILRSGTHVDLLLTDFAMPGMTGADLVRAARELRPDLPVLIATGYAEMPDDTESDIPRLAKPYQLRQLAAQLAKLLGNSG